jgi:hypothetical protein
MRKRKLYLAALILGCFGMTGLYAQDVIPAAGGNASGSGGTASYSIGQFIYTTYSGTNGSIAQGVQQPYEISNVIGIDDDKEITLQCSVFPNPSNGFLTLKVKLNDKKNMSYQVFDLNGKLLKKNKIDAEETSIVMSDLISSTYFIKVIDNNNVLKTFKIIKN